MYEAVSQGAGHDDGVEAGELVGQEVEVGDAAAGPEVAGVGSGVQGPDRDDEPQAVGGRDVAAAPGLGERDLALRLDHPAGRGGDGVAAQVVLVDPGQPAAGQRGVAGLDDWFQADVAGLGDQDCADADVEVLGAGRAFGHVGELGEEAGPAGDLEEHVGQVDPGQQVGDGRTQREQGRRLVQSVERGQDEPVVPVGGLDPDGGASANAGSSRLYGSTTTSVAPSSWQRCSPSGMEGELSAR